MLTLPLAMYTAVVVASVLVMIFGLIWYSPMLFGTWGMPAKPAVRYSYLLTFAALLVTGFFLVHLLDYLNIIRFRELAELAFWLWIAFVVPTLLSNVLREGKTRKSAIITAGYNYIALVLMMSVIVFRPW